MNNLSFKKIATATGLFLGAFTFSVLAASWSGPECAAPDCNTRAPINVSTIAQYKEGNLAIGKSSDPATGFDLEVGGNTKISGNIDSGNILSTGISVSGLIETIGLKVGGPNSSVSGAILTNDGTGNAVWSSSGGSSGFVLDSNYCYALRAGRFTRDGALNGYYLKGLVKSSDGNWESVGGVYCLQKGSSDSRMTAGVKTDLVNTRNAVSTSFDKTYEQIVTHCLANPALYAYGGTVTCPSSESF